ncbi:MAG: dockerin type I domain-containing protein [Phycisphaerales bacterium]
MTEQNRQFDDLEKQVSDRFRKNLRGLFEPAGSVPPQIDGAILEQARRRLAKPRPMILRFRWAAGIAAAAAVIALGVFLYRGPASSHHPSSIINHQSAAAERRADLDGNGRVDILDAFRLAKGIESRGPADSNWDINGDGRIDRADVDTVAFAAVRLGKGV